jgi:MFS family permease
MISSLKKFTNRLLKNNPDEWSTRWPWVLAIGLGVHILLGLLVLATQWDVRYETKYELWIGLIFIIIILGLVGFLLFLLRFNVFKRFGKLSSWHYVGTFLAYFITTAMIVSWAYNPFAVTSITARMKYDDAQVAKDINRMNVLMNTIEYDSIPQLWTRQKVVLVERGRNQTYFADDHYVNENYNYNYNQANSSVPKGSPNAKIAVEGYQGYIEMGELFYEDTRVARKDSLKFYTDLATDSTVAINDTSYYRFYGPDYTHAGGYHQFFAHNDIELDDVELFHQVIKKRPTVENLESLETELASLIEKYSAKNPYHRYKQYVKGTEVSVAAPRRQICPQGYRPYLKYKYKLDDLNEGIKNISERYYMWNWDKIGFFTYPMYYMSFALSLLLFLFRHNRKRSFFYSILAGVLLFIFSVTVLALTGGNSESILVLCIVYMIVFAVLASRIFTAERNSLLQNIGKNLFIYFVPLLPLIITALYYEIKKNLFRGNRISGSTSYNEQYQEAFQYESLAILGSQILGFVLFIILLHFVFSKLLRKSYALPDD